MLFRSLNIGENYIIFDLNNFYSDKFKLALWQFTRGSGNDKEYLLNESFYNFGSNTSPSISINENEIIVERSTNNFEDSDEIWVETYNYYSKYYIDKSKTKYNTNTKYNIYGNHYYAKIPNLFNQNELPVVKILTQANQDSIEIERLLAIETRQDKFEIIRNRCSPLIIFKFSVTKDSSLHLNAVYAKSPLPLIKKK